MQRKRVKKSKSHPTKSFRLDPKLLEELEKEAAAEPYSPSLTKYMEELLETHPKRFKNRRLP